MLEFHRQILKQFEPVGRNAKITLFGSLAKGNYRLGSDIDLAIVTKDRRVMRWASKIADKILAEQGKLITLKFIAEEELEKGKNPIIEEIRKGIVIYNGRRR